MQVIQDIDVDFHDYTPLTEGSVIGVHTSDYNVKENIDADECVSMQLTNVDTGETIELVNVYVKEDGFEMDLQSTKEWIKLRFVESWNRLVS